MRNPAKTAKKPAVVLLILLWTLLVAGCSGLSGEPKVVTTLRPNPTTPPLVDASGAPLSLGAQIFAARCTSCHGAGGRGDGDLVRSGQIANVPDFTDATRRAGITLDLYYDIITNGRIENMMPPWNEALSESERRAVAEYVFGLADTTEIVLAETPASGETIVPASTPEVAPAEVTPVEVPPTPSLQVGLLEGLIENGTEGALAPTDIDVKLFVLDTSGAEIFTATVPAENGVFRFENVPVMANYAYFASTVYNGVTFITTLRLGADQAAAAAPLSLPLVVYEVTNDPSVIEIDLLLNQTAKRTDGALDNLLVARFFNKSDRVYREAETLADGRYGSVGLRIPADAVPVSLDPARFVFDHQNGRVLDTLAVIPDTEHIVHVTYVVPQADRVTYEYAVDYQVTNQPELMLNPGEFIVDSDQFEIQGVMDFSGGTFEDYLAQPLNAGDTVKFDLVPIKTSAGSAPVSGQSILGIGLTAAGVLLIGGAGGLYLVQRRQGRTAEALVAEIARLDLQYQAKQIGEKQYQQRRDALKTQLADILRRTSASK